MDFVAVIKELRSELQQIDNLIAALQSFNSGERRGRPPKLLGRRKSSEGTALVTRKSKKAAKNSKAARKTSKRASSRRKARR